jgi:hypothetical protein
MVPSKGSCGGSAVVTASSASVIIRNCENDSGPSVTAPSTSAGFSVTCTPPSTEYMKLINMHSGDVRVSDGCTYGSLLKSAAVFSSFHRWHLGMDASKVLIAASTETIYDEDDMVIAFSMECSQQFVDSLQNRRVAASVTKSSARQRVGETSKKPVGAFMCWEEAYAFRLQFINDDEVLLLYMISRSESTYSPLSRELEFTIGDLRKHGYLKFPLPGATVTLSATTYTIPKVDFEYKMFDGRFSILLEDLHSVNYQTLHLVFGREIQGDFVLIYSCDADCISGGTPQWTVYCDIYKLAGFDCSCPFVLKVCATTVAGALVSLGVSRQMTLAVFLETIAGGCELFGCDDGTGPRPPKLEWQFEEGYWTQLTNDYYGSVLK